MPQTRENHRHSMLIRSLNNLSISNGSSRLDQSGNTCLGRFVDIVAKREKRVRSQHSALRARLRLLNTKPDRVHPAHLAGAHSYSSAALGKYDSVGLHMFHNFPRKIEVSPLVFRRVPLGND